jgi:GT2 family glycosyltransferase/SAM-dependent methyltransferase
VSADADWRVVHLDLADGPLGDPPAGPALAVLWWRDLPLGHVGPDGLAAARAGAAGRSWPLVVAEAVAPAVAARLRPGSVPSWLPRVRRDPGEDAGLDGLLAGGDTLAGLDDLPVVRVGPKDAADLTVVLCTRDRPADLARALAALAAQEAPPAEVVVVDNDPAGGTARPVVEAADLSVRLVAEPRPGLSVARNTGLRHVRTDLVAFTDDDAQPHAAWTGQLANALAAEPGLLAVTGLVLPADLSSPAARAFEFEMGGFSQGYLPRRYDADWFARVRWRGAPAWQVGAGADMAFRREAFAAVGGFDERLGAGAAGCSEDSELWYRLLAAGHTCLYEPAAVVAHHHRSDDEALRRQAGAYIEGHVAALFVEHARHRHVGELTRALVNLPAFLGVQATKALVTGRGLPAGGRIRAELGGYRRGLRHARLALRPEAPPVVVPPAPGAGVRPAPRRSFLAANPFPRPLTEGFFFREKMRAIHRVTPPTPVRRVLEVGGGTSALTARLLPGATVVAVDLDPAVANPVLAATGTTFVAADAVALPFRDGAFDAATLFDVLEHVPDDDAAAAEVRRVVRAGGHVVASSPNERWRFPYWAPLRRVCPTDEDVMAEWGHVRRGYRLERLDALFGPHRRASATFITPVTVVAHDLAFSRLGARARRVAVALAAPAAWVAYALHRPSGPGTETAAAWSLPDAEDVGPAGRPDRAAG